MSQAYRVSRISAEQVDAAYCLVSVFAKSLSLDEWRAFCLPVLAKQGGEDHVIVAANQRGYIVGVCIGAATTHPLHGHILDVWFFTALSVADEAGIAGEMLDHLKTIAKAEACDGIRIQTIGQKGLTRYLDERDALGPGSEILMVVEAEAPAAGRWHR